MKKIVLFIAFLFGINLNAQVYETFGPTDNKRPSNYIEFNNKMYYFARNLNGYGYTLLMATNGTAGNNELIANLGFASYTNFHDENEFNDFKIIYNNKLFFMYNGNLWSSDGTTAGTSQFVNTLYNVKYFKVFNGKLYFTANAATGGLELWTTDGTVAGTQMVKDIYPGINGAFNAQFNPRFTVFNNKLFFTANNGVNGIELWSTDGTNSGTSLFKDIRVNEDGNGFGAFSTGSTGYNVYNLPFQVVGNKMYFCANPWNNIAIGEQNITRQSNILYETDGTVLGTKYVQPPLGNANDFNYLRDITSLTVSNNKLFICGRKGFEVVPTIPPFGIHVLDGINPITRIKDMFDSAGDVGTSGDVDRYAMRNFNGDLYFIGKEGSSLFYNLWKMNPITQTFTQITNVSGTDYFSSLTYTPNTLVASEINNRLYFVKTNLTNGGILSTDGTAAGTQVEAKSNISAKVDSVNSVQAITEIPGTLFKFSNAIYFNADSFALYRLYFSSLSSSDFEKSTVKVYPNPASNQIHISFDDDLTSGTIKVISITGQTVYEKSNVSGSTFSLDVSNFSSGVYVVQVMNSDSISTSKFIKQ